MPKARKKSTRAGQRKRRATRKREPTPAPRPTHPVDENGIPVGMPEAFEVYFGLGINRSIEGVAEHVNLPVDLIHEWHEVHSWDQHVQERIADVNMAFAEQFHTQTQNVRSKVLLLVNASLEQFERDAANVPFPITSHADLEMIARIYERLNRANAIALESTKQLSPDGDAGTLTWADLLRTVNPDGRA